MQPAAGRSTYPYTNNKGRGCHWGDCSNRGSYGCCAVRIRPWWSLEGVLIYGDKDVGAGAASKGIVVLGEASEAMVHGGTVRWRRRRRWRRRWRWSGAMGAERETRRGANVLCSGDDRLHSAQGEVDFGNPNTPPRLD